MAMRAKCSLCGKELEGKAISFDVYCPSCFIGAVADRAIKRFDEFENKFNETSKRIDEARRRMEDWKPRLIPNR